MGAFRRLKKLDSEELWNYALRVLGDRAHSAAELRRKLVLKAASSADVPPLLVKLREYNLLDDRKFSEAYASSRLQNQGFGRFRVLRELHAKQVPAKLAEQAVSAAFAETDDHQLAAAFIARKYRGKDLPVFLAEEKNLASAYRRLRTAGFNAQTSLAVLKQYSHRTEDWSELEADEPNQ